MKIAKIYTVAAVVAMAAATTACSDVTTPKLQIPDAAEFKMVTPPLQDQYYKLTPTGTFDLAVNAQPSYGFSAVTQYRVQVAMHLEDFADETKYRELTPVGSGTLVKMTFNDIDLAEAITDILGLTEDDRDSFNLGIIPLYFRGVAFIKGVEQSYVETSNIVSLNQVETFFSIAKPGALYVIGNYAGSWIAPEAANQEALEPYTLYENEDAIRSKIYFGTIDFGPGGQSTSVFRFYTALTGWDEASVGPKGGSDSDTPVQFPNFVAGSTLEQGLTSTKDSFEFPNYVGTLSFEVNLADEGNMSAKIEAVATN